MLEVEVDKKTRLIPFYGNSMSVKVDLDGG